MAGYGWKTFFEEEDRPEKPRRYGVTEMRGPHYSLFSQNLIQDIFDSMGQFVDGLKFSGGSHSLMPRSYVKEITNLAHKHNVYVSTGDWAEHLQRKGPSAFKDYIEECKELGFDTIEIDAGSLGVPEEVLLRYVRLVKSGGLQAKPLFAVKFNKSDIPVNGDRAFGSYMVPKPRSSEFVEDVDLLIRRAERCLEAGADMIMIDADDVCRQADSVRADIIAKVIGRLGLEKIMFEASNPKASEWFIKQYGAKKLDGLKRRLRSRSQRKDVFEPEKNVGQNLSNISTKKSNRSGCSRSIANLKDVVIHGSKRHSEKPPICSPRSIGSSELLNPINHEVVLDDSTCELKITARCGFHDGASSNFVGMLKPGTPGPRQKPGILGSPVRRTSSGLSRRSSGISVGSNRPRSSFGSDSHGALFCHKCGDQFVRWDDVEAHHLFKHAVTELGEGDSSRRIVEIICRASCSRPDNHHGGIERILKVHNMQKTVAQFEEYREVVKIKASKLPKKHPRCLADGNELLRFHGATVECSLGMKGSSSLCTSEQCRVCRILRHGFSTKNNGVGVFTASTSGRAFESIQASDLDCNPSLRRALIVCRVIAGRVHRPLEDIQEIVGQSGFDSLAGKVGVHSNIEELYLLSPRALLPCFVLIYRP